MMATSDFRLWSVAVSPAKKIQIPDSRFQTSKHSKHHHDHMILDLDRVGLLVMLVELKSGRTAAQRGSRTPGSGSRQGPAQAQTLSQTLAEADLMPYASILCPTLSSDRIELNVKEKPKRPRMSE